MATNETITATGRRLKITFIREGQPNVSKFAEDGYKAVLPAMRLLAVQDKLLPGDMLVVAREAEADSFNEDDLG